MNVFVSSELYDDKLALAQYIARIVKKVDRYKNLSIDDVNLYFDVIVIRMLGGYWLSIEQNEALLDSYVRLL